MAISNWQKPKAEIVPLIALMTLIGPASVDAMDVMDRLDGAIVETK